MMVDGQELDPRGFGEWLKKERLARGLSQADLARVLGTVPSTVAHWEKGRNLARHSSIARAKAALAGDPSQATKMAPHHGHMAEGLTTHGGWGSLTLRSVDPKVLLAAAEFLSAVSGA